MEKTLTLPRLGETMEEGTVLAWSKITGEEYDRGDILLELETDKMVVEVPALEDGRILEILAEEGAVIGIGEPIARVEVESTDSSNATDSDPTSESKTTPKNFSRAPWGICRFNWIQLYLSRSLKNHNHR